VDDLGLAWHFRKHEVTSIFVSHPLANYGFIYLSIYLTKSKVMGEISLTVVSLKLALTLLRW
jgi:hypothetical protein